MPSMLSEAHHNWLRRPSDERFTNMDSLHAYNVERMNHSLVKEVSSKEVKFVPTENNGIAVQGPNTVFAPTHWAFAQACGLVKAPPDYLRDLPAELAADNLNWGYSVARQASPVKVHLHQNGGPAELTAITGDGYGKIYNAEVSAALVKHFGNGVYGNGSRWVIPGEYNQHDKTVTKQSTTLYTGDRDMFVFLCDSNKEITIPCRRNGHSGTLQRGFFVWNSDVGARSLGWAGFYYDLMCGNHYVWGVSGYESLRIRHTITAPDRFVDELLPALESYANSSEGGIKDAIAAAQAKKLDEKKAEFLANRFGQRMAQRMETIHQVEEERPIENMFDVVVAATAVARDMPFIGPRVDLEREASKLLVAA